MLSISCELGVPQKLALQCRVWLAQTQGHTFKLVNCYGNLDVMVFYESQKTLSTAHLMPVGSQTKVPVLPCAFKATEGGGGI